MKLIDKIIRPIVAKRVNETVSTELDRILPAMVAEYMRTKFTLDPNRELSALGFSWALILAFEDAWPDLDRQSAISCARDCLEVPYGTPGYDWSASAARELVNEYVCTYGEHP